MLDKGKKLLLLHTVFEEEIGALEEKVVGGGRILVGEKSQNGRPVERHAPTGRDLTAVASAERRVDQVDGLRVGNLRVEVDVLVTAPAANKTRTPKINSKIKPMQQQIKVSLSLSVHLY